MFATNLLNTLMTITLSNAQWGFRAGRSTVSALVSSTSTWFNDLDIGHDICSIFFDYKKAFDSVPHRPLLDKLVSFNFNMHLIHWIANYLTNRIQRVLLREKLLVMHWYFPVFLRVR